MVSISLLILLYSLAVVLTWRDLRNGLYLLVLTLPLNNRIMFDLTQPQLLPVRVVWLALFMVIIVRYAGDLDRHKLKLSVVSIFSTIKEDIILQLLLLYMIVAIISIISPINLASSLTYLMFFAAMIGLYIVMKIAQSLYGKSFLIQLYQFHCYVVTATVIFSLIQVVAFVWGGRILPGVWPSPAEPARFGSFFWDINQYAPYVYSAIPYFMLMIVYGSSVKHKFFYLIGFILTNVGLLLTLSRSGWIGAAFMYLFLGLLIFRSHLKRALIAYAITIFGLMTAIIIGVTIFNLPIYTRLYSLSTNIYNPSVSAHKLMNRGHFEIFSEHPVFGGGYGTFSDRFRKSTQAREYFEIDSVEGVRLPSHSIWFEKLSETGVVGMAVFSLLILLLFKKLLMSTQETTKSRNISLIVALSITASLGGILCSGLFYHYNLEYFWLLLFFAALVSSNLRYQIKDHLNIYLVIFIIGMATWIIFPNLGKNALIDWDESIYAQVAKNILRFRDPITLRWHIEKFWYEKPPLFMWLTSIMYAVNQVSEFSARFWSAIAGIFGAVIVYLLGRKMWDVKTGLIASMTLLSTVHWLWQSRNGTLDVFTAMLISLTLYLFILARDNKTFWKWVGVTLGLVLMSKGVIFVIPTIIMLIFAAIEIFIYHSKKYYPLPTIIKTIIPFGIIVLPWHLINYYLHGTDFINSYFFYHVVERAQGIEGHNQSFLWYLVVIKVWARHNAVLLVVASTVIGWRWFMALRDKKWPNIYEMFVILWAGITFVVLSVSVSKIQWYILPIYPALALIIARGLAQALTLIKNKKLQQISVILAVLGMILSVPMAKDAYRKLWDVDDAWRGVAEVVPFMKYEARKKVNPRLLIVNMSPGPAMFYTNYPTDTGTMDAVRSKAENPNEFFFAVGKSGDARRLIESNPEYKLKIYREAEDYALYGRW